METIKSIKTMKLRSRESHDTSQTLGFVPTMGCLHEGHLSLIRHSIETCDTTVVSIFLNPTQFGKNDDLNIYPQTLDNDRKLLNTLGVNILFLPNQKIIYPEGFQTFVTLNGITNQLCGESRPLFFRGIATIVLKLFNIIQPHKAFFGEKDRQQLEVIRTMVRDLNLDVEISGLPIIRESDGLAMSSRNLYLSSKERKSSQSLFRALKVAQSLVEIGEFSSEKIKNEIKKIILQESDAKIDYISICDPETFADQELIGRKTLIAIAVQFGKARLIDNCIVENTVCRE